MCRKALLLLLLCRVFPVFSQSVIPRFEVLGVNEGLSQSSVYSIFQDKAGYIWFGTGDGLNRYDGKHISVYKISTYQPGQPHNNFIRGEIFEDRSGNLWYSTRTGICFYNRGLDRVEMKYSFLAPHAFNASYFEAVLLDSLHNLWLFNRYFGLVSYNTRTGIINQFPYTEPLLGRSDLKQKKEYVIPDSTGITFMIKQAGIFRFDIYQKKFRKLQTQNRYYTVRSAKGNVLAINNDSVRIETVSGKIFVEKKQASNSDFLDKLFVPDNYGRLWIGTTSNGLLCYAGNEKKYYRYGHNNSKLKSLPIDMVTLLYQDRNDNLWIGTDGGGVCRINLKPSRFNLFPLNEGDYPILNDYFTKCFYEDEKERIWFGTLRGINIFDPKDQSLINYQHDPRNRYSLPGNEVSGIFKDSRGRIWIATNSGVALFDEKKRLFNKVSIPARIAGRVRSSEVTAFFFRETQNGDIVVSTNYGLLFIATDSRGNITCYHDPENIYMRGSAITDICETVPGEFWFTASLRYLVHVRKENSRYISLDTLFPRVDLRCISRDGEDKDILWIGSGLGLIKLNIKNLQYRIYNVDDGLANGYIYGVLEDKKHQLWLSTNGGLSMFDKKRGRFINYDYSYGLQSNEFNTGAWYKSQSGKMYFGGVRGFNWFNPEYFAEKSIKPQVAISGIWVNDTTRMYDSLWISGKRLALGYHENNLLIRPAALDFTMPEANKFQYQLEGWDPLPVLSTEGVIRYSQLTPGDYAFRIKASNSDDVWSMEKQVFITIATPFWQTWWFYVFIGLIVLTAIVLVTRNISQARLKERLNKLERQQALHEERRRISREMHDDIGAGLTQISLMSEAAALKTARPQHELKDIAATSRKLVSNMSEIIWSLNPENRNTEQLFAYLREQLSRQLEYTNIDFQINLEDDGKETLISNQQKRNIILITKELVNNAIKYSKASRLSVRSIVEPTGLFFEIKDNGIGFDLSAVHGGNGIRNVYHRIQEMEGEIQIASAENEGTYITYNIPL